MKYFLLSVLVVSGSMVFAMNNQKPCNDIIIKPSNNDQRCALVQALKGWKESVAEVDSSAIMGCLVARDSEKQMWLEFTLDRGKKFFCKKLYRGINTASPTLFHDVITRLDELQKDPFMRVQQSFFEEIIMPHFEKFEDNNKDLSATCAQYYANSGALSYQECSEEKSCAECLGYHKAHRALIYHTIIDIATGIKMMNMGNAI